MACVVVPRGRALVHGSGRQQHLLPVNRGVGVRLLAPRRQQDRLPNRQGKPGSHT